MLAETKQFPTMYHLPEDPDSKPCKYPVLTFGFLRHFKDPIRYCSPSSVLCLVAQSCLTLCDPMDYSLPASSVHWDSPRKNTGVGCRALFQEIFPSQGSNAGLPHCRWILYYLSHQGRLQSSRLINLASFVNIFGRVFLVCLF